MSHQPPLFPSSDEPYNGRAPFQRHSRTSRNASDAINPKLNTMQATVLALLRKRGEDGATDDELLLELGWSPNTVRPRRRELVLKLMVHDSGRERKTQTGVPATVWVANS